jgi:hypothetical protein
MNMSSQDSTNNTAAAVNKKRRRVVKRRRGVVGGQNISPPSRLGWLGDGMLSATAATENDEVNDNYNEDANIAGSQNSSDGGESKLLTPRPETAKDDDIDLTGGGDESDETNSSNNNNWACRKCTLINPQTLSM